MAMAFDRNENRKVAVLLGAGSMGTAILRRVCAGMTLLFGDISEKRLDEVKREYRGYGYAVETMVVDANSKESIEAFAAKAHDLGEVKYYIHTAGHSPNQASPEKIIGLDLIGSKYALDHCKGRCRAAYLQSDGLYVPASHRRGGISDHDYSCG